MPSPNKQKYLLKQEEFCFSAFAGNPPQLLLILTIKLAEIRLEAA
jgi:hypothetical protein